MATASVCFSAALLLVSFLSGCGCHGPIPPPDDQLTEPRQLIDLMRARLEGLQSARFRVVSEVYGDDLRGANFRQVVLVRQPDDLHIQVLSPFDQTLSVLVCDGEQLALYDLEAQVYYHGSPTPRNIARLLPFYLSAPDIVRVLLGGPPLDLFHPDESRYALSWDGRKGSYLLRVPLWQEEGTVDLWVHHGDWLMEGAIRRDADGQQTFELRTGHFERSGDVLLPTRLRALLHGESEVDLSLTVESADVNVALRDELFTLAPPAGVRQVDLDQEP
ncbi:MAG: DUF4292 domain-containing protein [Bradymonadales bacterium]|nr:DUF4292 domain-containing protein [Bradymonadales bacterium]